MDESKHVPNTRKVKKNVQQEKNKDEGDQRFGSLSSMNQHQHSGLLSNNNGGRQTTSVDNASTNFGNTRITITKEDMSRYFNAPQVLAARLLNVSVSTLKRRFYEMYEGRWPYQKLPTQERKKTIWFYINEEDEPEKNISDACLRVLNLAFVDATQPKVVFFPEEAKSDKPRKKDITFLSYIPQGGPTEGGASDSVGETLDMGKLKGGSRQKYSLIGGIGKKTRKMSKKK